MPRSPRSLAAAALAVAVLVAGCGGDDDDEVATTPALPAPADTAPDPVTTPPAETQPPPGDPEGEAEAPPVPPGEQQGDEEAIRSEAVFSGRGGELRPRRVRVPAYIAVRVILRSVDGGSYELRIGGTRLAVDGESRIAEADLDGLLPGEAYEGRSPEGNVRVVPSAEPGP